MAVDQSMLQVTLQSLSYQPAYRNVRSESEVRPDYVRLFNNQCHVLADMLLWVTTMSQELHNGSESARLAHAGDNVIAAYHLDKL